MAKINYGSQGDELAVLVTEELGGIQDSVGRQIVASRVLRAIRAAGLDNQISKPSRSQPRPMGPTEAKHFESRAMPWGKYEGQPVSAVPLDYLGYIVDDHDEFKADVRRYLDSSRVKHEDTETT